MRKNHVGDVIVIESRVPVGIATDRDIVIATIAEKVDANTFSAEDLMNVPVAMIKEGEGFISALTIMKDKKVRRLPIVTEAGALAGIITSDDLISSVSKELFMMTDIIADHAGERGAATQLK